MISTYCNIHSCTNRPITITINVNINIYNIYKYIYVYTYMYIYTDIQCYPLVVIARSTDGYISYYPRIYNYIVITIHGCGLIPVDAIC